MVSVEALRAAGIATSMPLKDISLRGRASTVAVGSARGGEPARDSARRSESEIRTGAIERRMAARHLFSNLCISVIANCLI